MLFRAFNAKCEHFQALLKRSVISGSLVGLLVIFRDVSFALVYCSPVGLQSSKTLMMVILGKKSNWLSMELP